MHNSLINLQEIKKEIYYKKKKLINEVKIIAVSKNFGAEDINPLLQNGHIHFGENKVQEAIAKWVEVKKTFKEVELHMLGKLQSNKVKYILPLFDYLHSLDSLKLAEKIQDIKKKNEKKLKIFIQVNIGNEEQKSGVHVDKLKSFYIACVKDFDLNIIGLMCIPPNNKNPKNFFEKLAELNKSLGLKELSMGMSSDYLDAIEHGASFIRIGTKIFGNRNQ